MKEKKELIWTSITPKTKQRIKDLAELKQASVASVIREALLFFLERITTKEPQGKTTK